MTRFRDWSARAATFAAFALIFSGWYYRDARGNLSGDHFGSMLVISSIVYGAIYAYGVFVEHVERDYWEDED